MNTLTKPRAKKPARVVRKAAQSAVHSSKAEIPADLRPLRAGAMKFSKQETALMDRADIE
jgi:hypothetical protein